MSEQRLQFGYNNGLPENVTCAWGARWIITQSGDVDQVYNRQDSIGSPDDKQKLFEALDGNVGSLPKDMLSQLLRTYRVSTSDDKEVLLYDDGEVIVKGSPQRSHGYFYVCAYFEPKGEA